MYTITITPDNGYYYWTILSPGGGAESSEGRFHTESDAMLDAEYRVNVLAAKPITYTYDPITKERSEVAPPTPPNPEVPPTEPNILGDVV